MRTALCAAVFLMAVCARAADTSELQNRRQRAAAEFGDGILMVHAKSVGEESGDGFRQDPAFYYFTGLENTVGAILAIDGRSHESWLFLRPPTPNEAFLAGPMGPLTGSPASDAVRRAGIEHVVDWSELADFLEKEDGTAATTFYYPAVKNSRPELPPNIISDPPGAPLWALAIAKKWPSLKPKEASVRVKALMDVQSPSELVNVRAAAKATVQALIAGIHAIRPGVSQRSVEATVEDACWKAGAHGAYFWPWAMSGLNGVFPNPYASFAVYDHLNSTMNTGDLVRLDVGCEWNHYGGDLGRTIPVSGHYSTDQREVWNIFVSAYHAGVKSLREGATVNQVFEAWRAELVRHRDSARSVLARQAVAAWSTREKVPFWGIHTMNLDEGSVQGSMRAGTTIAFEPIASIGGEGYYLEDLFLITKEGSELLTPGVPYSAEEIEAAMRATRDKSASRRQGQRY
jgi:Xaa-Pro aminopeptidase